MNPMLLPICASRWKRPGSSSIFPLMARMPGSRAMSRITMSPSSISACRSSTACRCCDDGGGEGRLFPVIIVSARGDWTERVAGIDAGADDYLSKPFEMGELIARVRGVLRRVAGRGSNIVTAGRVRVDTQRLTVDLDGVPVRLSPLEFRLLDYLVHNAGRAVPTHEIADHLYGAADSGGANAIEALITRLRRKVGAETIVTRRGFGYSVDVSA
jgi:DNA-binding response OmpR family regulator